MSDAPTFNPAGITAAVAAIEGSLLQPIIRKAADDFYEQMLNASHDYLRDNLDHNLKSHLDMLERENKRMQAELHDVDSIIGPPWMTPVRRIEVLRELEASKRELTTLKYEMAFPSAKAGQ